MAVPVIFVVGCCLDDARLVYFIHYPKIRLDHILVISYRMLCLNNGARLLLNPVISRKGLTV